MGEREKLFRISWSTDEGHTWHSDPNNDLDETYFGAMREAKQRSRGDGKIFRVENIELRLVIIAFRDGISDIRHYKPRNNPHA